MNLRAYHFAAAVALTLAACSGGGNEGSGVDDRGAGFAAHGIGSTWTYVSASEEGLAAGDTDPYPGRFYYRVTDTRMYRGLDVVVVEAAIEFTGADRRETEIYFDSRTGNAVAYFNEEGVLESDITPHDGYLSLPFEVGKTWEAIYTETFSASGEIHQVREDYEVVGFEEVTVPAGVFMAFQVTSTDEDGETSSYFYDPDLEMIVKFISMPEIVLESYDLR